MNLATEMFGGSTVSDAWLRTVAAVNNAQGRRLYHCVTRIAWPTTEEAEVRAAADWLSDQLAYPAIDTVANTIFPQAVGDTSAGHEQLANRYRGIYDSIRAFDKANRHGTYFGRLVCYPTPKEPHDQIAELIRKLRVELASSRPKSTRYEVGIGVPSAQAEGEAEPSYTSDSHAVPVYAVGHDKSPMGFPCLSFCSFQLDGDTLHMVAHYRRQHLIERGYGNYLGLGRLLRHVSGEVNLQVGHLMVVAGIVTVEAANYRIAQLQARAAD